MKFIIINLLIFLSYLLHCQEIVSHLKFNPLLNKNVSMSKLSNSFVSLPFIDDFSSNSYIADSNLWQYSSIFINRTYGINPPTIGVATFDGLGSDGLAYSIDISNPQGDADILISNNIDLSNIDSIYLMFYYQPQGFGDNPQTEDSLVLEIKNENNYWNKIWSAPGDYNHEFIKHIEIINDPIFLHSDFQFRFRNKATLSGNFDHWNIDYVKVDEFTSILDTSSIQDISFVYNPPSFLRRYSEMPWNQFKEGMIIGTELADSIDLKLRNNQGNISVQYQYNVYSFDDDASSLQLTDHYPSTGPWRNVSVQDYDSIGNFSFNNPSININNSIFPINSSDSSMFFIQHIIKTALNDYKKNDTLNINQNFFSHYSYDDGIAESAYGINVNGAKIAYQFELNRPDKLRAVQMYFPQMLDSVNDISFRFTVWNDNAGIPGDTLYTEELIPYHSLDRRFYTYHLKDPFMLPKGTFYIGWKQNTNDLLNIGLDKNNIANQYMFYDVGGGWTNSQFPGSWMIRPVLNQKEITNINLESKFSFSLFPNPANQNVFIKLPYSNCTLNIYNMFGALQKEYIIKKNHINLSLLSYSPGIYIIEVIYGANKKYKKLIVQ